MSKTPTYYIGWVSFIILFALVYSCAQRKILKDPDGAYEHKQYDWAIKGYLKKYKKAEEEERYRIAYRIADSYLKKADFANAYEWAVRAYKLNSEVNIDALIIAINAAIGMEQYDSAEHYLNLYTSEPGYDAVFVNKIRQVLLFVKHERNKGKIQRLNNDINSESSDCCPVLYNGGVLFGSQRKEATGDNIYGWDGQKFSDIFFFRFGDKQARKLPNDTSGINTEYHEGTPYIVQKGDTTWLYFTRCAPNIDPEAPVVKCHIYRTYSLGEGWTHPEKLMFIGDHVNEGHPAVGSKYIYFVSDDPDGRGGKDIYRTYWTGFDWAPPENIKSLNTVDDEMFPSLYGDTLLIFSSNGRAGFGNLDVFIARRHDNGEWEVVNAGKPINSGGDDFGVRITGIKRSEGNYWQMTGYVSSNRVGSQRDDIYYFEQTFPLRFFAETYVYHTDTPILIKDVQFLLFDVEKGYSDTLVDTNLKQYPSIFRLEEGHSYIAIARKKGYMTDVVQFRAEPTEPWQLETFIPVKFYLRPIEIGKEIVIPNIYYAYDDWKLLPEAFPVLDTLALILQHNPDLIVEIGSHTDCRGSDYYNLKLSFKRAQSVVYYLIDKGIPPERLRVQGYGETQPIIDCGEDCSQCTEEQHAKNRRTSFRIVAVKE